MLRACLLISVAFAQAPDTAAARVVSLTGSLTLQNPRQPVRALHLNDAVQSGDELVTGENSHALLRSPNGASVTIYPDSRVIFNERSPDISEFLHLLFGSIKVHIEKLSGRPNPHKLTTPTAVIAVRGTIFSVFVDDVGATLVAVDEGLVAVANVQSPQQEVLLAAGQRTWVRPGQPPLAAQAFRGRSERAGLIPAAAAQMGMGPARGAGSMGAMGTMGAGRVPPRR